MAKSLRHEKILELVKERSIETQEELQESLNLLGFAVTQATISRDIRRLKLTKSVMQDGALRYVAPEAGNTAADDTREKFRRLFCESVTEIDRAGNMIVIRALTGTAMGVAAALDGMKAEHVLGSIAGDDTVFVLVRDEEKALSLVDILNNLI